MAYYIHIEDNKIFSSGECPMDEPFQSIEVTEEVYNLYLEDKDRYMWNGTAIVVNPDYQEIKLNKAKLDKYTEANDKAKEYIDSGNALFEFAQNKHIEATDGNIGKLTAYALAYVTGQLNPEDTVIWNTKEDETIELTKEQIGTIIAGLGQVQAEVWAVKFADYVQQIKDAANLADINRINIDYTQLD